MHDLISQLPVVVYEYAFPSDGQNKFQFVSEQALPILGIEAQLLMQDIGRLRHAIVAEDQDLVDRAFSRAEIFEQPACGLVTVRTMQGKSMEIRYSDEVSANLSVLRRGVIQERISTNAGAGDVSSYADTFDRLPIAVVVQEGGNIVFANRHAHGLMGAEPGKLLGIDATKFIHADYLPAINERIKHVSAGEPVPMAEEKFLTVDGRVMDVETMAFPFLYKGRQAIQVIFRDITQKKLTEAQVRKNETLFTQLFQNIPTAVVMLDQSGKVAGINKGFEQMFGFKEDDLRGKNLNDYIVPDDLRSEGIDLNNLIASNQVVSIESVRRHRSGRLINVILYGVPVMLDSQAIGIYGVYVDITERKKVEEELKIRNAELDNFVYKVSHDLRAPLSSVLGLVNLSRLDGNRDDPHEYLQLIGQKILALDNFIGDVLSHSKNLKIEVTTAKVDLQQIIEQTFTDLGYLKGAQETRRLVKIEGIDFYSDHWRISEIFRNLISNAIKYRRPDADDSEIVIKVSVDHLCADITFADNGIGVKEESLKRIFEMFYRATDQGEGSGIGLYIVKNAVEKLGGQIRVASRPGQGTRFHILVPNRIHNALTRSSIPEEG